MPEQACAWLRKCKAVILDLDGVVYLVNKKIPGADTTINTFYQKGLKVFFLTNNSTASRNDLVRKLRKLAYNKFKCPIYFSNCDKKFPGPTLVLPGAGSVFESVIQT
uniref:Haloacid dehalogenase-like hydrolase domain-containing protein 2 n=1 Tax=Dermatophagoides pteronyssinus TaxID=6956 RepID=A0A6P6Y5W5_DERPT|nr:haloacid dehalogenase-like hydrolase domain-containing protein 2 [Dermatophagoides pteronyssinus]